MRILLPVVVLACVDEPESGPLPVYDPQSYAFFDSPWPADARRDRDGTVDMASFPNPTSVVMLDKYKDLAGTLDGFGTNGPVYFRFEQPLETWDLPSPEESMQPDAAIALINIDSDSDELGMLHPITWTAFDGESAFLPPNLLAFGPLAGWPLRPDTTYAAVVSTQVAQAHPAFKRELLSSQPSDSALSGLVREWTRHGRSPDDIAVATTFTTRDPTLEMGSIAQWITDHLEPPNLNQRLEFLENREHYTAWRTHYPSPVFTHGERPFTAEGGGFAFRSDGSPIVASWDDLRLAVCTPKDLAQAPEDGWPVVLYQHGTGGAYRTFCNSDADLEVANRLGKRGFIGLGIDQPLHDTRNGGEPQTDLANFNFLNPDSVRSNHRQGAADALYLAEALADAPATFTTPDGRTITTDPNNIFFMGHSQGGTTGALAAPWLGRSVKGAYLSGAGGLLSITLLERKDILDFEALLHGWFNLLEDEQLSLHHPGVALLQFAIEETDTVNYAPYWFSKRPAWAGQEPLSVLMTSGTDDQAATFNTAIALATAAGLPPLAPTATPLDALALRGETETEGPFVQNAAAYGSVATTAAFVQWDEGSHWVAFEVPKVSNLYMNYFSSLVAEAPEIGWRSP